MLYVAGNGLRVVGADDNLDDLKQALMEDMESAKRRFEKGAKGVCLPASALGSFEALLEFLRLPPASKLYRRRM